MLLGGERRIWSAHPGNESAGDPGQLQQVHAQCELAGFGLNAHEAVERDLEHAKFVFEVSEDLLIIGSALSSDALERFVGFVQTSNEHSSPRVFVCAEDGELLGGGLAPSRGLDHGFESRTVHVDGELGSCCGRRNVGL